MLLTQLAPALSCAPRWLRWLRWWERPAARPRAPGLTGPAPVPASPATPVLTPVAPVRPDCTRDSRRARNTGSRFSLEQVIDLALANNPLTRISYRQARATRFALQRLGGVLPTLELNGTYWRGAQSTDGRDAASASNYGPVSPSTTCSWISAGGPAPLRRGARHCCRRLEPQRAVQDVVLAAQSAYFRHLGSDR